MKFTKTLKAMIMSLALLAIALTGPLAANAAKPTDQLLHKGMENKDVKPLQTQLKKYDYYHDLVDGDFGTLTTHAVKDFQTDRGLDIDGIAGSETMKSLKKIKSLEHTYQKAPLLKQGSHGKIVKKLQSQLKVLDFYQGKLDGIYGSRTENAVKGFQKSNKIDVDGIAGPDTFQALIHNPINHQTEKHVADHAKNANRSTHKTAVKSTTTASHNDSSKDKKPSAGTDQNNVETVTVSSTAYTAHCPGCSGKTATGIDLLSNPNAKVIAVDPSVIPLGSKVYVPGYGYAVAGDTGGAIKGNRIDVFIPNHSKAAGWGRKTVQVKVFH